MPSVSCEAHIKLFPIPQKQSFLTNGVVNYKCYQCNRNLWLMYDGVLDESMILEKVTQLLKKYKGRMLLLFLKV